MPHGITSYPGSARVLIAGGGIAALETMLALRALAEERVDVELLAPNEELAYKPLSVAAPFDMRREVKFPMAQLVQAGGGTWRQGTLASVDSERKRVRSTDGAELSYDFLVIAVGGLRHNPVAGALAFGGDPEVDAFREFLRELECSAVRRVVFALAGTRCWPLPLYELALMTARRLRRRGVTNAELTLVTPEDRPLGLFGPQASDAVAKHLRRAGLAVRTSERPIRFAGGVLSLIPGGQSTADEVVTLAIAGPRLIPGLPRDAEGFLRTDEHGRVAGLEAVYAAGDATSFPIKQGGIAAQQADAVAESIAAEAGALVTPRPIRPVLRGMLLTGDTPAYLRREIVDGGGGTVTVDGEPLWWPPAKIVARYLGPFLAKHAGTPGLNRLEDPDGLLVSWESDAEHHHWHEVEERSWEGRHERPLAASG